MDVLALIDKLDDLVHNARAVPLTDQVRIDREAVYELLDQMRSTIPEEIKQARWIVKERQEMLAEAKREVIAFTDAQGAFDRLLGRWHQLITQKLETETPPRVVGKDITAIRAEVKAIHDEIAEIVNFKFQDAKKEISAV